MTSSARQLCSASQSVAATIVLTVCPICGRKVNVIDHVYVTGQGKRDRRPIIPAHVRDEHGEIKVKVSADRNKYPGRQP